MQEKIKKKVNCANDEDNQTKIFQIRCTIIIYYSMQIYGGKKYAKTSVSNYGSGNG